MAFVIFPPITSKNFVIFGKNSDGPPKEVHEIVYTPGSTPLAGFKIKCSYIEIDQADKIYSVILSKPTKCWGAEMGANECGVCIGNRPIDFLVEESLETAETQDKCLTARDIVRLALERASTSEDALNVILDLLTKYSLQNPPSGGDATKGRGTSFLIADKNEAWVLEIAGTVWAAEKLDCGSRQLSTSFTIGSNMTRHSDNMLKFATAHSLWSADEGDFNFAKVFGTPSNEIEQKILEGGTSMLSNSGTEGKFKAIDMMAILRDKSSGICVDSSGSNPTSCSQVSVIGADRPDCHWFTGTPDPSFSVFKPFIFTPNSRISPHICIPENEDEHRLYSRHKAFLERLKDGDLMNTLHNLEMECLTEVESYLENFNGALEEVDDLFKDAIETELRFYK